MSDLLNDPDLPVGLRRALSAGAQVEEIRLDARGRWFHRGEGFDNQRIAGLFHRSVARTEAGNWLLQIAPYAYPIVVELTGRFVTKIPSADRVELLGGDTLVPDWSTARTDGVDVIVLRVDGAWARVVDNAYQTLVEHLDVVDGQWTTALDGHTIPLPLLDDADPLWQAIAKLRR